jgi:hypothetical protein
VQLLLKEELTAGYSSVLSTFDLFIPHEITRKTLKERAAKLSFTGEASMQLVNMDELMNIVMPVWQEAEDDRIQQRINSLGEMCTQTALDPPPFDAWSLVAARL